MSSDGESDRHEDGDDQDDGQHDDQDAVLDDPMRQQRRERDSGDRSESIFPQSSSEIKLVNQTVASQAGAATLQ